MIYKVTVDRAAEAEWREAVLWYEADTSGAGRRLNVAILDVLGVIAREPGRFRPVTRMVRKTKVPSPWPYSIYFTVDAVRREVRVLAIWHGARDPKVLGERLV